MLKRQRTGSVLCTSCGVLVGVNDAACYNCGRRNPGLWGWAPALRSLGHDLGFTPIIIGSSVVMYVLSYALTLVAFGGQVGGLLSPASNVLLFLGGSGAVPLYREGNWLSLLSASWLHGNIIHILFNMLGVWQLVPAVAELYGPGRTVIIYTLAGAVGFFLSSTLGFFAPGLMPLFGSSLTVGASASVFGLIGAAAYYGRRSGSRMASNQAWSYAISMGAYGFILPGVDNAAHIGGFAGGYLIGRLLDPLTHERIDHVVIGGICLLASVGAIVPRIIYILLAVFRQ